MSLYASLWDIKTVINTQKNSENEPLLWLSEQVSRRIDNIMQSEVPFFAPYKEDRAIEVDGTRINSRSNSFRLGGYLLELDGATLDGSALVVGTNVAGYPTNTTPFTSLRLLDCCQSWYDWCNGGCNSEPPSITVSGIWGYRRRGGKRWVKVGTLTAAVDADDTLIPITKIGTGVLEGESSILSAGNLIRIDSEYMLKSYTPAGNTVERAVNGTTAASHLINADVYVYVVEEVIRRATARQAGLMLARRGAYDVRNSNELGTPITYPSDLLAELYGIIQGFSYL